ncbi:MAG: hypothetical protein N2C14_14010 [Planctomycetales bacterium]
MHREQAVAWQKPHHIRLHHERKTENNGENWRNRGFGHGIEFGWHGWIGRVVRRFTPFIGEFKGILCLGTSIRNIPTLHELVPRRRLESEIESWKNAVAHDVSMYPAFLGMVDQFVMNVVLKTNIEVPFDRVLRLGTFRADSLRLLA